MTVAELTAFHFCSLWLTAKHQSFMVYTYVVRSSLLNSYSLVLATTVGANRVLKELLAWIRLTTLIDWSTFTTFSEMSW